MLQTKDTRSCTHGKSIVLNPLKLPSENASEDAGIKICEIVTLTARV